MSPALKQSSHTKTAWGSPVACNPTADTAASTCIPTVPKELHGVERYSLDRNILIGIGPGVKCRVATEQHHNG